MNEESVVSRVSAINSNVEPLEETNRRCVAARGTAIHENVTGDWVSAPFGGARGVVGELLHESPPVTVNVICLENVDGQLPANSASTCKTITPAGSGICNSVAAVVPTTDGAPPFSDA